MSIVLIFHDICRFEKVPIVPREFGAGFTESHEKQGNISCIFTLQGTYTPWITWKILEFDN